MATEKKTIKKEKKGEPPLYFSGLGRRKTSVARVRIFPDEKAGIIVNGKNFSEYFPTPELQKIVGSPLERVEAGDKFKITVLVRGGGIHSQAEAVRHGISRALVRWNENSRKQLKRAGYLTRDPRMKERKKFGLKKARKAPQWSKR